MPAANIMYKTLGFKWLLEAFCPASTFATADREVARNPQRFIHVPLCASVKDNDPTENNGQKNRKSKPF